MEASSPSHRQPQRWRPNTDSGGAWTRLRHALAGFTRAPGEQAPEASALEVADVLCAARALIEPERSRLRGQYRRPYSRFCTIGALRRASRHASPAVLARAHALLLDVARQRGFETVERMNDYSTHPDVLSAFDAAITAAVGQLEWAA